MIGASDGRTSGRQRLLTHHVECLRFSRAVPEIAIQVKRLGEVFRACLIAVGQAPDGAQAAERVRLAEPVAQVPVHVKRLAEVGNSCRVVAGRSPRVA